MDIKDIQREGLFALIIVERDDIILNQVQQIKNLKEENEKLKIENKELKK